MLAYLSISIMIFIRLLILVQVKEALGGVCIYPKKMITYKDYYKNVVKSIGPLSFIFNYKYVEKPQNQTSERFLESLLHRRRFFYEPLIIREYNSHPQLINIFAENSLSTMITNSSKIDTEIDLEFLKDEKCAENVSTSMWKVPEKTSYTLIFFACKVNSGKNSYIVSNKLILLSDKFHYYNITKGIEINSKMIMLEKESFCYCNYIHSFFNECKSEKRKFQKEFCFLLLSGIVFIFISMEIYLYFKRH